MKEYLKNPTIMVIGAVVITFLVANYFLNKKLEKDAPKVKAKISLNTNTDEKSDFCGCGA
jgi:hypothetical protein